MKGAEKLVPELRFSRFDDDWGTCKLSSFTKWGSGGTPSKKDALCWGGNIPWISASSMQGNMFSDSKLKITELGLKHGSRLAPKGTILLLVRGSMLFKKIPVGITGKDVSFNQDVKQITVLENSTSVFVLQWFLAKQNLLLNMVVGTGIGAGKLDTPDLKDLKVELPTLSEQQKITNFLSAVDKKIEKVTRKKDLLETYKKGVMQKIFSREIRFKDENGKDYPDWVEKPLGKTDVRLRRGPFGSSLKKSMFVKKEDSSYKVYEQKHAIQKDITIGEYYITNRDFQRLKNFEVLEGDYLMSCSGTIGELVKIPSEFEKGIINQALLRIRLLNDFDEKYFLFTFQMNISQLETKGSGIKNLGSLKFLRDEFIMPTPKIEEQKKIANFLSAIDKKIQTVQTQLTQTQDFKKGLLQKMFV